VTWTRKAIDFLFPAGSDQWLTILRLGLGLVVVLYVSALRADWHYLLGGSGTGLISRELSEAVLSSESPLIPRLGWLVAVGRSFGRTEQFTLSLALGCLLAAGLLLLPGLFCRAVAIVAWFLQLSAAKSAGLLSYGVDNFITIGLFYLMIAPLPDHWALDRLIRFHAPKDPRLLGFHRRVLQIHLCLIYFFSGLTKCLGRGWWDGSNIWRALTLPPFDVLPTTMVASWRSILPAMGIAICLLETSYAVLIWPRRTRQATLVCICLMHLAIGLTMGMYLFALIMIVLNLAAFAPGFLGHKQNKLSRMARLRQHIIRFGSETASE
jgi:hypothetical protein